MFALAQATMKFAMMLWISSKNVIKMSYSGRSPFRYQPLVSVANNRESSFRCFMEKGPNPRGQIFTALNPWSPVHVEMNSHGAEIVPTLDVEVKNPPRRIMILVPFSGVGFRPRGSNTQKTRFIVFHLQGKIAKQFSRTRFKFSNSVSVFFCFFVFFYYFLLNETA